MAVERHLILCDRERLATRDTDLPGHQIQAGDGFGHGVFDLQAGVHLHKEEFTARVEQKFHRAGAHIADGLSGLDRSFAHGATQFGGKSRRRRFLDDLLVAALDRTITLVQVQAVTVLIGKDLNLHVARFEDVFLNQHPRVAKGRLRLTLSRLQRFGHIRFTLDHLHAFAAPAGGGLEQHRVANLFCSDAEGFHVLRFAVIARHERHAGFFHQRLGGRFAAHGINGRGGRAEEDQASILDGASEARVLREEAVAGMDRLCAAGFGGINQLVDQKVTVGRLGAAEVNTNVRLAGMPCISVDGAVHGNGGQAHGLGGAHHAAGDFAPVRDQQGGYHCSGSCVQFGLRFSRKALTPSCPSGLTRMRAMAFSV